MVINGLLHSFPKEIKILIAVFILVLSVGFYTGLLFVNETSTTHPNKIEEHYLGNEDDENATVMKFKKNDKEMLTLVHNHILSLSVIFFIVSLILSTTNLKLKFKLFLIIEPFISIIATFIGLYLLWSGVQWMKYIVMVSGILMTLTYTLSILIIYYQLLTNKRNNPA